MARTPKPAAPAAPVEAPAVWKHIDALRPWENNPRKNDPAVPAIVRSVLRFGFPTVCTEDAATGMLTVGAPRLPDSLHRPGLLPRVLRPRVPRTPPERAPARPHDRRALGLTPRTAPQARDRFPRPLTAPRLHRGCTAFGKAPSSPASARSRPRPHRPRPAPAERPQGPFPARQTTPPPEGPEHPRRRTARRPHAQGCQGAAPDGGCYAARPAAPAGPAPPAGRGLHRVLHRPLASGGAARAQLGAWPASPLHRRSPRSRRARSRRRPPAC